MRLCLATVLLIFFSNAIAVECGPTMSKASISQMRDAVFDLEKLISRRSDQIGGESRSALDRWESNKGRTNASESEEQRELVEHLQNEQIALLALSPVVTMPLKFMLLAALSVAEIRDAMLDSKDREIANSQLSRWLADAKEQAVASNQAANSLLSKYSRPELVSDLARTRETIGMIAKDLEGCERASRAK